MKTASEQKNQTRIINLLGPAKQGKTTCAATASAFCPELPHKGDPVKLEDTVYWQFDTNGTETLKSMGVDPFMIDMSNMTEYRELRKGIKEALSTTKEFIGSGKGKVVVLDTLTTYDEMLVSYLGAQERYQDERMRVQMYGKLKELHMKLAMDLKSLPGATIICCFHTKVLANISGRSGEDSMNAKLKQTGLSEGDNVIQLTGSSANYWRGSASANWPVVKSAKGPQILPYGGRGYEGGCRWLGLDTKGEPANLRKIFEKVGL